MDSRKLKAALVLRGYSVDKLMALLSEQGVPMTRNTWFKKLRGQTEFTRKEIEGITKALGLAPEEMLDIFFKEEVS